MSGEIEYGECDICFRTAELNREYYRYNIKCECHSGSHFEIVRYCVSCKPKEPTYTKLNIKTENLRISTEH